MEHSQVLIVGAGPTGLTLAAALAQSGIECSIVDRLEAGLNTSRALVIHAHTLELLDTIGVGHRIAQEGRRVPRFVIRDRESPLLTVSFSDLPARHPYALMLPQSRTEFILEERCKALGVTVQRPCVLVSVRNESDHAYAVLEDGAGRRREVRAGFVVAADGMHSTVREQSGIGFTGSIYPQSFILADVEMHWPLSPEEVTLFFSPAGLVVVAPMPGERHRIVATVDDAPASVSRADVQRILDERGPRIDPGRIEQVVWSSRFRVHHKIAETYHRGRILLAGDSAHVHSPAGGQGMNTGIQDAMLLAEILARVITSGSEHEPALREYEAKRRPVAERVRWLSARLTRFATLTGAVRQTVRNGMLRAINLSPRLRRRFAIDLAALNQRDRVRTG